MKKNLLINIDTIVAGTPNTTHEILFAPGLFFFLGKITRELGYSLQLTGAEKLSDEIRSFILRTFEGETITFTTGTGESTTVDASSFKGWENTYRTLASSYRKVSHNRTTKETAIDIELNLDGTGQSELSTGLNFFNHMLEQIAKHGGIDLKISAKGDLHIDEHHTIEDTAITLGETFLKALGDKRGIERYGFCLPMDDALAQVAIDFGGRNWIVWEAEFKREKVGDVPTELFFHFFKSFSDAAKCNLNIKVEGDNEHHKIEAIFKAFAKAIKMAVKRDANNLQLPSTKGLL